MDEIEKKQDELASFFSFIQDQPNSASMKDLENTADFNKQVQNSLITYGDSMNTISKNDLLTKNQRNIKKKLTYHSPLLSKISLNNEDSKNQRNIEENSQKKFQDKHFLKIEINENKQKNIKNNNNEANFSASQRLSYNQKEKNLDLCELALVFESMKCYKSYFPHNNAFAIIKEINDQQKYNMRPKKSKRKKFQRSYINSRMNLNSVNLTHSADEIQIKEKNIEE